MYFLSMCVCWPVLSGGWVGGGRYAVRKDPGLSILGRNVRTRHSTLLARVCEVDQSCRRSSSGAGR